MSDSGRPRPTEAADRTALAWTRTSLAFLGNGALLMIRNLHGPVRPTGLIPAFLAAAVALGTYVIALRRQSTLQQPAPARITPRRQVYFIGTAVLVLIVVTTVAQLI
ncbi:MAG TPA: DUF202 domain-containing protein [Mycobacterium sp.]|nr:DUF202 domain-containing protein [Mycobacterium sp.]